jgi:hypothetical protein
MNNREIEAIFAPTPLSQFIFYAPPPPVNGKWPGKKRRVRKAIRTADRSNGSG